MSKNKQFLNLTGKALNVKSWNKSSRVNVETNRTNTKIQEGHNSYDITKKGPFIWATDKEYIKFAEINAITEEPYKKIRYVDMLSSSDEEKRRTPKPKAKKVEVSSDSEEVKVKTKVKKVEVSSDKEEIKVKTPKIKKIELEEAPICKKGVAGTVLYNPDHTDPSKMPKEALEALCPFQISGLKGWAVVTDVTDGDTLDIVIYVPLNELALGHSYKKYTKTGVRSFIHTKNFDSGFFAKFRTRLLGIDSSEHDTPEGKFATEVTRLFYNSISGRVWYEFTNDGNIEKRDKYGRTLVNLYADDSKKVNYNEFLFQFNTKNIVVVEKYDGGTKSKYTKGLASRDKAAIAKVKKKLDIKLEEYKATLLK